MKGSIKLCRGNPRGCPCCWAGTRPAPTKKYGGIFLLISLIILLISAPYVLALNVPGEEVLVSVDVTPKDIQVGDVVTMTISIKHNPEYSLYLPDYIDLAPFDIIDTKVNRIERKGSFFSEATFKVAIYQAGTYSVPSVKLLLKKENRRIEVATPERHIQVTSVLNKEQNSLLEIYPPIDIRQSYMAFLIYVWIASLCMFIAIFFYIKRKNRKVIAKSADPAPKIDPHEAALHMIQNIFSNENLQSLSDKELCEKIAFTVKYFVKEKFNINSLEMTSNELVNSLTNLKLREGYIMIIFRLLMECDLVKFANKPLQDNLGRLKDDAIASIDTSAVGFTDA